jgi:hypothetical protein
MDTTEPRQSNSLRRHSWLVAIVAALILLPRGVSIVAIQGVRVDDGYHLSRGIRYWYLRLPADAEMNDPPLGEALSALPIIDADELPLRKHVQPRTITDSLGPDSLRRIAVFKSLLFVPAVVLVFRWVAGIYNMEAGWLAAMMVLIEPTFAAHIPLPTVDVLGVEGILFSYFLAWRWLEQPTTGRGLVAGFAAAMALMTKHTAVILPAVVAITAFVQWYVNKRRLPQSSASTNPDLAGTAAPRLPTVRNVLMVVAIMVLTLWALTGFIISQPPIGSFWKDNPPAWALVISRHTLPGGTYIGSFLTGMAHDAVGHRAMLFGRLRIFGWWYYFPAIATMKIPLGIGAMLILGAVSLWKIRPRWQEWSLVIPALAWGALLLKTHINIGFRHFLPAYVFMLMLSARCLANGGWGWRIAAWAAVAWAGIHTLTYHPDYISYVNRDIPRVWLEMDDSNIDWSQSSPQIAPWVEAHIAPGRPVAAMVFGDRLPRPDWIGPRVTAITPESDLPTTGILIISPNWITGQYTPGDRLRALRQCDPIALIHHSLLVFDLDALGHGRPFDWSAGGPPRGFEDWSGNDPRTLKYDIK